jgi:glucose/mannose-6-phosphate isomerase
MREILRMYNTQFEYVPEIINEHKLHKSPKQYILCGMGGSHLPAGILKTIQPGIDIYVHRDYDLPPFSKTFLEQSTLIAMSHSGNTEEVISFYKKVKQLYDMPVACIATGGQLIELAQKNNDPHIILPQTEFVPRTALGYSTIALSYLLKERDIYNALHGLRIDIASKEQQANSIADSFQNRIPLFYASNFNLSIAYNWKIKCNETAKIPAFYNVFPESNHNELESFEYLDQSTLIHPVIFWDEQDDGRIKKRFEVFMNILDQKNIAYSKIDITNTVSIQKVFSALILGDFVATTLAEQKNIPIAEVPLIEEFKKRII